MTFYMKPAIRLGFPLYNADTKVFLYYACYISYGDWDKIKDLALSFFHGYEIRERRLKD
jgi:hypothetical protein